MNLTLEEFYNKHKDTIVAIYQTGSAVLGIDSDHDIDYAVWLRTRSDAEKIKDDIVWLKRSSEKKVDVFINCIDEPQEPSPFKYYSALIHYNELLYGTPVSLYQVLDHREEQVAFLKRFVNVATGKRWVHVYVLAVVLQRNSYELNRKDYATIKAIHDDGITEEQKAAIIAIAKSL